MTSWFTWAATASVVILLTWIAYAQPTGTNTIEGTSLSSLNFPVTASATGTTASVTATLAASVGLTNYICGFSIRANASAAITGNATVTGTFGGTLNFTQWIAPLATGLGVTEEVFIPCESV
jgi:hypothetical protein